MLPLVKQRVKYVKRYSKGAIHENHPFYSKIIQAVDEEQQGMLELAIASWSRMEEESSSNARAQYRNARIRWGEVLTDFLLLDED